MSRIQYAAVLLCICAAPLACNDAPNRDVTGPEVVSDDLEASLAAVPLAFRRISAGLGSGHSCGVTTTSLAYCWGYNGTGAIGDGSTIMRLKPTAVAGMHRFQQVSAGYDYTCGVTSEFQAYCWGSNNFNTRGGQLGDGTKTRRLRPVAVLGGHQFQEVSTGVAHTCGRTTANRVYCWGSNESGQIGDGTNQDRLIPKAIGGTLRFRQITVGGNHSCGIATDDRSYCWGANREGQIGNGSTGNTVPTPTALASTLRFRRLDGGGFHTCGVTTDGRTFCWGENIFGQLGDGTTMRRTRPRLVVGDRSYLGVEAGAHYTCGVSTSNLAYCWGNNQTGTLGDGTTTHRLAPVPVAGGHRFSQVSAGGFHSCGTTTGAAGYCWGENFNGGLGDGTRTNRTRPRAVVGP